MDTIYKQSLSIEKKNSRYRECHTRTEKDLAFGNIMLALFLVPPANLLYECKQSPSSKELT